VGALAAQWIEHRFPEMDAACQGKLAGVGDLVLKAVALGLGDRRDDNDDSSL
jgi:hypothetical protein